MYGRKIGFKYEDFKFHNKRNPLFYETKSTKVI